jgi:hypothetical protein
MYLIAAVVIFIVALLFSWRAPHPGRSRA